MSARMPRAACALAAVVLLAGCSAPGPVITPVPEPSSTPLFASDAEALQAATDAYAAYLEVSGEIFRAGGEGIARLKSVATGSFLKAESDGFETVRSKGLHSDGDVAVSDIVLQTYARVGAKGVPAVTVYLCEDVSEVKVFDSSGASVVSSTRPARVKYEVQFEKPKAVLLISDKRVWGSSECD